MIWLYDNIEMRIEGRIVVRVFPTHPPRPGLNTPPPVASGWTVNRGGFLSRSRPHSHPRNIPAPAPFFVLGSRALKKDADRSFVFSRALTNS